jgi:glycosyltransferase involved in cell wall biosynthesis
MNILYPVLCYYPSQAGGPANTLYWQNTELAKNNIGTITVSTSFGIDKNSDEIQKLGDSISYKNHLVEFTEKGIPDALKKSVKYLKEAQIIHFSSIFFPVTLPLLIISLRLKKVVVISPRGELYNAALQIKPKSKCLWIALIKRFQRKINFHATNEYEAGLIKKFFPRARSVEVINNFIKIPEMTIVPVENKFIFLGRINPIKNIHLLINAFYFLVKDNEDATINLVIVGSARLAYEEKYLEELRSQVKELGLGSRVSFRGHLEGEEKEKELASAKALVLPSKSENFGNVVLESLAQGTPVIASTGTPWEILDQKKSGYWIAPTTENIFQAMQDILNLSEYEYAQSRKNCVALCKNSFDVQSNIHLWVNYYKKVTTYV